MWIQISSGKGPLECERGTFLFYKKFYDFCKKNNFDIKELNLTNGGENNTIKSVLISINNLNLENTRIIKSFEGTIKWISESPFRKNHKRKNWFIKVEIFEEIELDAPFLGGWGAKEGASSKDITIKTTRASGKGGQHVNKTDTAVQITHIPTGISFKVKEERSQIMNKKLAIAKLNKALINLEENKKTDLEKDMWTSHNELERGNAVKTYKGNNFKI